MHGGAITTLVDIAGAAALTAAGVPWKSGVSLEINISCLDAACVNVSVFQSLITLALSLIIQLVVCQINGFLLDYNVKLLYTCPLSTFAG